MRKIHEIRNDLAGKQNRFADLANNGQRTDEQNAELATLRTEVRTLMAELDDAELVEAGNRRIASQGLSEQELQQAGNYSFRKAIADFVNRNGNLEGFEAEMHQEAQREAALSGKVIKGIGVPMMVLENARMTRASAGQNKTTANEGGNLVQEEPLVYIDALRNRLVLVNLGARFITGLVGNLPLVNGGSFTATWGAEADAVSATKMSLPKKTMTPKRMAVCGAYSVELLNQSSIGIEMLLRNELLKAHANGLESAAINSATSGPVGVLNTSGIGAVAGGDNGLAPTWAHMVNLETEVAIDNADLGALAYLTNAKVRGKLKQTLKASGVAGYVWDGNTINGYNAAVTNAVPSNLEKGTSGTVCSAIIFGNWNDMIIGQWGGYDMIVDPYSLKKVGDVEVVLNSFHDVALANAQSFAAMKDALTA
jgi:HK97 family phage major capsid protein